MPMTEGMSPKFAAEFPESAIIFNNRFMVRDNINDILTTDLLPIWEEEAQRNLLHDAGRSYE